MSSGASSRADLAGLLAVAGELGQQIDQQRAAPRGARDASPPRISAAPVVHEELRLDLALVVEREVVEHQLVQRGRMPVRPASFSSQRPAIRS